MCRACQVGRFFQTEPSPPETVLQNALSPCTVCAEVPANIAETTNEQGAAVTEDYYSPVVENERLRKRKHNPNNWNKKPRNPTNSTTDIEIFRRESVKLNQVIVSLCGIRNIFNTSKLSKLNYVFFSEWAQSMDFACFEKKMLNLK